MLALMLALQQITVGKPRPVVQVERIIALRWPGDSTYKVDTTWAYPTLRKMGAKISLTQGRYAVITGPDSLDQWLDRVHIRWQPVSTTRIKPEGRPVDFTSDIPRSDPWGIDSIGAPAAWAMGAEGRGVLIGIMDTGTGPNTELPIQWGHWYVLGNDQTDYTDGISSCNQHGTHKAGILVGSVTGIARKAKLAVMKVFYDNGGGCLTSNAIVLFALQRAADSGLRLVNNSVELSGDTFLQAEVAAFRSQGGIICAASGNDIGAPVTPLANYAGAVGVSATDMDGSVMFFANVGPQLQFGAPGNNILSSVGSAGNYATRSGTSEAAPHVCGALALILSADTISTDNAVALLRATADLRGDTTLVGQGRPRADYAVSALVRRPPTVASSSLSLAAGGTDSILVTSSHPWVAWTVSPYVQAHQSGSYVVIHALPTTPPGHTTTLRLGTTKP